MQDQFTYNRLTFNVGLRAEQWKHFASTGEDIFTFDWAVAPRLSAAYDLRGDGKQKVYGYYGRYYDPIRNNMTNFAGTLSGFVREEQVFINNDWVTYRTRGGLVQQDAFFAPSTKTPYTDDITAGYQVDLGQQHESRSGLHESAHARHPRGLRPGALRHVDQWRRPTILGPINDPQSLWLGLDYFGYTRESRIELRDCHAQRRQAELSGRRFDLPQALQRPLAAAGLLYLQLGEGQHELRLERGLPGRCAVARSPGAGYLQEAARHDPARLQGCRFVHLAGWHRARRGVPLQLGNDRQSDRARTRSATCRFR